MEKNDSPGVTRQMIAEALRSIGLNQGDILAVHSSLSSLGFVQGGAKAVISALQDALTPSGTLMMPAHTYSFPMWEKPPYDAGLSASLVGKITDVFRRMPGVRRSIHPTHSVAAWGRLSEHLTRDTLNSPPVGIGSPWHRLLEAKGRVLMLGTKMNACTLLHLCEVLAEVPYLEIAFTPGMNYEVAHKMNDRGEVEEYILYQVPGCSRGFPKSEPYLKDKGVLRDVRVVTSHSLFFDVQPLAHAMVEKLKEDPYFLLCENPDCSICSRRRQVG
jgi:aminoglycoside 3-N-acetyltransferase